MITDPQFVHRHFLQNPSFSIPGLFVGEETFSVEYPNYDYISLDGNISNYIPFETLPFDDQRSSIKIVQSCNGLLLCSNLCNSWKYNKSDCTFYIFNPFTKQHRTLPQSQLLRHGFADLRSVSLAFDPFTSPHYKVISIWSTTPNTTNYRIEIYDSETSSWKLSGFDPHTTQDECILSCPGIFWNGSLYWCYGGIGTVVYFDIHRELIGTVPSPVQCDYKKKYKIAEYRGKFYLAVASKYTAGCFDVFRMDAAYTSWNFKGRVDLRLNPHRQFDGSPPKYFFDHILFIVEGEEESTKLVLLTRESKIILYDLKEMSFGKIYDLSPEQDLPIRPSFYQNIESLACV